MDWKVQAKLLFNSQKPDHFTNYRHCCECAEHDRTLLAHDPSTIGIEQLGNPGWDPLCFCSSGGLLYLMPALIRITVDTLDTPSERYLDQFLFHLIGDGPGNRFVSACTSEQRQFVMHFLEYLIENPNVGLSSNQDYAEDLVRAHDIWSIR